MLLLYGSQIVKENWYVKETNPTLYCRIYFVRTGHVRYRDEHTDKILKTGHLYIFPSTKPYEITQDPANRLSCLHLHVEITPYLLPDLVELQVEEGSFLMHLLDCMDKWIVPHPYHICKYIDPVIEHLTVSFISYIKSQNLLQLVPEKLSDSIQYISEHVKENITVEHLSELCGYHKQYYIRMFYTHLGTTPHQYLIRYRMNLAFSLLMEGRSVSETADLVGYPEVRNFIRAFHKHYGYPPGKIMKHIHLIL